MSSSRSISILVFLFFIAHLSAKGLKFRKTNNERSYQFSLKVFETLKNIPHDNVCIWSDSYDSYFPEQLVQALSSKVRFIFQTKTIQHLPKPCSHSVAVLQHLSQLDELFAPGMLLSAQHSVYTVVTDSWPEAALNVQPMLDQHSKQFGSARVFVVMLADEKVFSLSSPFFNYRRFLSADMVAMAKPLDLGPVDLQGRTVNVAAFNCTPFVIQEEIGSKSTLSGIEGELLNEVSRRLNFTMDVVPLKGNKRYGIWTGDSWNGGIIQAMADKEADICLCNFWITARVSGLMNFGPGHQVIYVTFIVPRPRPIISRFQKFIAIFDWNIWVSTIAVYFLITFCYWLFCNTGVRLYKNVPQQLSYIGPTESGLAMLGMCTLSSWHVHCANCSTRQLVTWWAIFVLLLTAIYCSTIASNLTKPRYERKVETIRQLVELGYNWYDYDYNKFQKKDLFFNLQDHWQREWEKRYVDIPNQQMLMHLKYGRMALPVQRWGQSLVYVMYEKKWGIDAKNLRVIKQHTADNYVSFGYNKITPLIYPCKKVTQRILEAGLMRRYVLMAAGKNLTRFSKLLLQESRNPADEPALGKKLGLADLFPAFFNLAIGLVSCVVLFTIELIMGNSARTAKKKIITKKFKVHFKDETRINLYWFATISVTILFLLTLKWVFLT